MWPPVHSSCQWPHPSHTNSKKTGKAGLLEASQRAVVERADLPGFPKGFQGHERCRPYPRTRPWFRFFASEPDCSEYSEQRFIDKLLEMTDTDSFTNYIGWCQAFARFRRESNLEFGRRRLMRTGGRLLGLGPTYT